MSFQTLSSSVTGSADGIFPDLQASPLPLPAHTSPSYRHSLMYIPLPLNRPQAPGTSVNLYFSAHSAPTPSRPSCEPPASVSPQKLSFLSPSTKMLSIYFKMEENESLQLARFSNTLPKPLLCSRAKNKWLLY